MISWVPETSEIGALTLYRSSLDSFRDAAGVSRVIEIRDPSHLTDDVVTAKLL